MNRKERPLCLDQAYRFLARRDHSAHELGVKLRTRDFKEEEIEETIAFLLGAGYLNDARYCELYARGRVERMRVGPRRLRTDLLRKGFGEALIAEAIENSFGDEGAESDRAVAAAQRKLATLKGDLAVRDKQKKIYDYLMRRGYSNETAREVALDRFSELVENKE